MHKKFLSFALALGLMVSVLPRANAASQNESQIMSQIRSDYEKCLTATEKESLGGFCGLAASWQMYFMGINQYPVMADGNKQFDTYRNMELTTGGYRPKAYSAEDYTLEQALNAISRDGTRNVYNMVVGFEKTSTEAGALYGHAVVVYAILDGMVYFTESFATSFGSQEGQAAKLSIADFARYYDDWMTFEGVIQFEKDGFLNQCTSYPADLFVEMEDAGKLLAEPRHDRQETPYREVQQGELLHVTGLFCTPEGLYDYQVEEDGEVYYVAAEQTAFLMNNDASISYVPGRGEDMDGRITAQDARMQNLRLNLQNDQQEEELCVINTPAQVYDLSGKQVRQRIAQTAGEESQIQSASVALRNYHVQDGKLVMDERVMQVGQPNRLRRAEPACNIGWVRKDGQWYFYWDDEPVTGWLTYRGCHYYMDENGAAVTGEKKIDGRQYRFSQNGALLTD